MSPVDKIVYIKGPDPSLQLTYNDVWLPGLVSRRILCFELPHGSSHDIVVDSVTRALEALVQGTPELGAISIIVPQAAPHDSSQPWRALAPGDGIHLVVKDMTGTFQTYQELKLAGFPLSAFKDANFMPASSLLLPEPQPVTRIQLNLIEGGVCLSYCIYHHLTDGNGMNAITIALGEECAKAAQTEGTLPPRVLLTDRKVILSMDDDGIRLDEHPAYRIIPGVNTPGHFVESEDGDVSAEPGPPPQVFVPGHYHLSHNNASKLKEYASRDGYVSTHDAISALLWHNIIKTRVQLGHLKGDEVAYFTIPHDARKYIDLPREWVGNLTYFILASAAVSDIIQEDNVPMLARKIRIEMEKVNRQAIEQLLTLRRKDPYALAWWPIGACNEPNMVAMTSMYHSGIMGRDWGKSLGPVQHFTSTDIGAFSRAFQQSHYVGPMLPGGRGCNVHVGLLKEEAMIFSANQLWSQYFQLLEMRANHAGGI